VVVLQAANVPNCGIIPARASSATQSKRCAWPIAAEGDRDAGKESPMSDQRLRRWAGAFGVGGFVVFLAALPLSHTDRLPSTTVQ
jgi:hypothetical protein